MATATGSTLNEFPVELKQKLLSSAPDILSLRSMALSCSSLYYAVLDAETMITTQVVNCQFESLPEAFLLRGATDVLSKEDVESFVEDNFQFHIPKESWTLAKALPLTRLHSTVERLASGFITEMLSQSSAFAYIYPAPDWPVSRDELTRIYRAFYRFELFCYPFRRCFFSEKKRWLSYYSFYWR